MAFVLDASVTLAMCFGDERSTVIDSVGSALSKGRIAHVPTIWSLEVINGLLNAERRKRVLPDEVARLIQLIEALPIEQSEPVSPGGCAFEIGFARQFDLSAYDAAYLALARRRDLPLATVDTRLAKAAGKAGIELFKS